MQMRNRGPLLPYSRSLVLELSQHLTSGHYSLQIKARIQRLPDSYSTTSVISTVLHTVLSTVLPWALNETQICVQSNLP